MTWLARVRASEPLRLYVYPALVAVVGILIVRGYLDADLGDLITAIATLIIGIPAAEVARKKVTPQDKVIDAVATGAQAAITEVESTVRETLGEQGVQVLEQVSQQIEAHVGRHRRAE